MLTVYKDIHRLRLLFKTRVQLETLDPAGPPQADRLVRLIFGEKVSVFIHGRRDWLQVGVAGRRSSNGTATWLAELTALPRPLLPKCAC